MKAVTLGLCGALGLGTAMASDWDTLYDAQDLARTRERTVPGVQENFSQVIWPALTSAERDGLAGVQLAFPDVGPSGPLDFYATAPPATVNLPLTSLRFYADLCLASAWLNRDKQTPQAVYDYVAMLRYRGAADFPGGRYPQVLPALGIAASARDDSGLDQVFYHCYASTVVFIVGHELAHLLHRDPGYAPGVPREAAQRNEARADEFALELMRRLGAPPIGTPVFFMALAHLEPGRFDFDSEPAWRAHLAQATHPLTADRLRAIAAALATLAPQFARGDAAPATAQARIVGAAIEIGRIADFLDDQDIQHAIRLTALATDPTAFAARHAPDAAPAGTDAFDGRYAGDIVDTAGVALPATMTLTRSGDVVTGRYHFGMGDGVLSDAAVRDGALYFDWRWGEAFGRGVLRTDAAGALNGTWGYNADREGGGTWRLQPAR